MIANMKKPKKYVLVLIFILFFLGGILYIKFSNKKETVDYTIPLPEEVVAQYFTAWNNKNYPDMYATLSDGFKKIDPYAKDLATFKEFSSSQRIENIEIINIKEISNDDSTAAVSYSVNFILADGTERQFSDKFSLKLRQGDVIRGWKLIHPYGENIDTS